MIIKKTNLILFTILSILGLSCAACELEADIPLMPDPGPAAQTWIDAPLDSSTIPLATYQIVFHAASSSGVGSVELLINGQVVNSWVPEGNVNLYHGSYDWLPPVPGTYLIEARASSGDTYSIPAHAQVQVAQQEVVTDTPTPSPTATPTPTPTPTQEEACTVTALVNFFCRQGPGKDYEPLDSFTPGQSAPVVGQSIDGFFWYVNGPNFGYVCTIPDDPQMIDLHGNNCDSQPRFTPIPTPTPSLTPTPGR